MKKLSKKTKIAIITFIALGISGVAVIKIKQYIEKRRNKKNKKPLVKNKTMNQLLKIPDDLKD